MIPEGSEVTANSLHLPLYLWRPFKTELKKRFGEGSVVYQRIVVGAQGLGSYEGGQIRVEDDAVIDVLVGVLNKRLGRTGKQGKPKLTRAEVIDYIRYHEDTHRLVRSLGTGYLREIHLSLLYYYGELKFEGTTGQGIALEQVLHGDPEEARQHIYCTAGAEFYDGLKRGFADNYGEVYLDDLRFVEELIVVYITEADILGNSVRLVADRKHPKVSSNMEELLPENSITLLKKLRAQFNTSRVLELYNKMVARTATPEDRRWLQRGLSCLKRQIKDPCFTVEERLYLEITIMNVDGVTGDQAAVARNVVSYMEEFEANVRRGEIQIVPRIANKWFRAYERLVVALSRYNMFSEGISRMEAVAELFDGFRPQLGRERYYKLVSFMKGQYLINQYKFGDSTECLVQARKDLLDWQRRAVDLGFSEEGAGHELVNYFIGWSYVLECRYAEAIGYLRQVDDDTATMTEAWAYLILYEMYLAAEAGERANCIRYLNYYLRLIDETEINGADEQLRMISLARAITRIPDQAMRLAILENCPRDEHGFIFFWLLFNLSVTDAVSLYQDLYQTSIRADKLKQEIVFVDEQLKRGEIYEEKVLNPQGTPPQGILAMPWEGVAAGLTSYLEARLAEARDEDLVKIMRSKPEIMSERVRDMFFAKMKPIGEVFADDIARECADLDSAAAALLFKEYLEGGLERGAVVPLAKEIESELQGLLDTFRNQSSFSEEEFDAVKLLNNAVKLYLINRRGRSIAELCNDEFTNFVRTGITTLVAGLKIDFAWDLLESWEGNLARFMMQVEGNFGELETEVRDDLELYEDDIEGLEQGCLYDLAGKMTKLKNLADVLKEDITELQDRQDELVEVYEYIANNIRPAIDNIEAATDLDRRVGLCGDLLAVIDGSEHKSCLGAFRADVAALQTAAKKRQEAIAREREQEVTRLMAEWGLAADDVDFDELAVQDTAEIGTYLQERAAAKYEAVADALGEEVAGLEQSLSRGDLDPRSVGEVRTKLAGQSGMFEKAGIATGEFSDKLDSILEVQRTIELLEMRFQGTVATKILYQRAVKCVTNGQNVDMVTYHLANQFGEKDFSGKYCYVGDVLIADLAKFQEGVSDVVSKILVQTAFKEMANLVVINANGKGQGQRSQRLVEEFVAQLLMRGDWWAIKEISIDGVPIQLWPGLLTYSQEDVFGSADETIQEVIACVKAQAGLGLEEGRVLSRALYRKSGSGYEIWMLLEDRMRYFRVDREGDDYCLAEQRESSGVTEFLLDEAPQLAQRGLAQRLLLESL